MFRKHRKPFISSKQKKRIANPFPPKILDKKAKVKAKTVSKKEARQESLSNYNCVADIYNCSDLASHDQAQEVYEFSGGLENDIHRLDSDKDGSACESLP